MASPNNLYFQPADGLWEFRALPMVASVAMPNGAAIGIQITSNTTTGYNTLMGTENAAGADFQGILMETISSSDADYATEGKLKLVAVPVNTTQSKAYFKVGSGTFTAADVNKTVEFYSDSLSLAVDTAGKGARITDYISSSQGKCTFPMPATETA